MRPTSSIPGGWERLWVKLLALSAQGAEPDPTQGVQAAFWTEGPQETALPRASHPGTAGALGENVHRQC